MPRGEDEDVGRDEQVERVAAVTQELEPRPEVEHLVPGPELVEQHPLSGRREVKRESAPTGEVSGVEQYVVALLGSQASHRHHQKVLVRHTQLAAQACPDLVTLGHGLTGPGLVDAVDDDPRPTTKPSGEGPVGRVGDGQHRPVSAHRDPVECLDRWGDLVPEAVLGVQGHRPWPGDGEHGQAAERGGIWQVEVHDVEPAVGDQPSEARYPSEVDVARGPERMHG